MTFEELEHTADIRMRVKAPSLEALFSEAARALMTVMYGSVSPGEIRRAIQVDGEDTVDLIQGFLSEVLYISEVEDIVVSGADVRIEGTHLSGDLFGEPFSRRKHSGGREVKGISYSGMAIGRERDSYILDVIFDV